MTYIAFDNAARKHRADVFFRIDDPIHVPGWEDVTVGQCLAAARTAILERYGTVFDADSENTPNSAERARMFWQPICSLAQHAAAVVIRRWSKMADIELEPDLERALLDIENSEWNLPYPDKVDSRYPMEYDSDYDMLVSEYIGELAAKNAVYGRMRDSNAGIIMAGAKYEGSPPSFTTYALDTITQDIISRLSEEIGTATNVGAYVAFDAIRPSYDERVEAQEKARELFGEAVENRKSLLNAPDMTELSKIEGGIVIVCLSTSGYTSYHAQCKDDQPSYYVLRTLSTLGMLPDDAKVCCSIEVFGSGDIEATVAEIVKSLGWPVVFCDDGTIESTYSDTDFIQGGLPSQISWSTACDYPGIYKGGYTDEFLERAGKAKVASKIADLVNAAVSSYPVSVCTKLRLEDTDLSDSAMLEVLKSMFGPDDETPCDPFETMTRFGYGTFARAYVHHLTTIEDYRNHSGRFKWLDDEGVNENFQEVDLSEYPVFDPPSDDEENEYIYQYYSNMCRIWDRALAASSEEEVKRRVEALKEEIGEDEFASLSRWEIYEAIDSHDAAIEDICRYIGRVYYDWNIESSIAALNAGVNIEHLVGQG